LPAHFTFLHAAKNLTQICGKKKIIGCQEVYLSHKKIRKNKNLHKQKEQNRQLTILLFYD
jgi:hypothetical protein